MPDLANSNRRLLARATEGDRRAFAAIFERYHQRLYRYCAAIVGDPEDARDALQNTMVRVLAALPGERRAIELEPWLYRIAHNEAIDVLRRRRPSVDLDSVEVADTAGLDAGLETRERLRRTIVDLRELPERQRGALVMRELGGLSFEQIGEAFGTSARVARQTVYEARISLQDMEGGRAMPCDEVRRRLSDGDRRLIRRRDVRAHLRQCPRCRDFEQAITSRREELGAIAPLSALAAGGIAKALVGAGAAGHGAGAGAVGPALGGSVLTKTVATGAVVAAIGVATADRSGLIQVVPSDDGAARAPAKLDRPGAPDVIWAPAPNGAPASTDVPADAAGAAAVQAAASPSPAGPAPTSTPHLADEESPDGSSRSGGNPSPTAGEGPGSAPPPSAADTRGSGAANAHGANPNANEHASTKSNNGQGGGHGKLEGGAPQHGAPASPSSKPHKEPGATPAPPAKGLADGSEAPGKSGQSHGKSGKATE